MVGASASPKEVASTSTDDFSFSREPPKPDIIADAISLDVPSSSNAVDNSSTSAGAVLINASHGAIWFLPKIALAAAICSDSDNWPKASCSSFWICVESFMVPSEFVTEIPSLSIASAASFGGSTSLAKPVFRLFAACSASIPALAMTPIYKAASLIE